MRRVTRLIGSVGVVVALVAATTTAVAKSRREERHTLKTFHACPRGVCAEIEVGRFVDLENPAFLVDPAGKSHLTNLDIDTAQQSGRLVIRPPQATDLRDQSFVCVNCIHRTDVDRTIVQLRAAAPGEQGLGEKCLGARRALQGITYDALGNVVVSCVAITDTQVPPPG